MRMLAVWPELDTHPDQDEIEHYAMGGVDGEALERMEEHLLLCEACQQRVANSDAYVLSMRSAARLAPELAWGSERRPWWGFPRFIPVLAGAVPLVLAATLAVRLANPDSPRPALAVYVEAARGEAVGARAPAGTSLILEVDIAGLARWDNPYRLEIVDRLGGSAWRGEASAHGDKAAGRVPELRPGVYFIRLSSPMGELLREYGLVVERSGGVKTLAASAVPR